MFEFIGNIESSKSLVNRALIAASYNPNLKLQYQSMAEDVRVLENALKEFRCGKKVFDCGSAGTAFRFWCVRMSREPGTWTVRGSRRLLSRPQQGLLDILSQLSVEVTLHDDEWILHSRGWRMPTKLSINTQESSQFISSMILNAWNLEQDLILESSSTSVSQSYLEMTLELVKNLGMNIEKKQNILVVKSRQWPQARSLNVEADVSSSFSLVACAVQGGSVTLQNFPQHSLQPDVVFVDYLKKMGAQIVQTSKGLEASVSEHLTPLTADLTRTPDLFPVLAVLCARAQGESQLSGLSHLVAKESDRLLGTMDLLKRLDRPSSLKDWCLTIEGREEAFHGEGPFDPDQDHRMAMAAQVANFYGAQFDIQIPSVVNKSFPQFWKNIGVDHGS